MTGSPAISISTERLLVRQIKVDDVEALCDYALKNREHFRNWEPLRADSFYCADETHVRICGMNEKMKEGAALHLLVFLGRALIGTCNFTNIVRGPFQGCNLGFSIDREEEGKGLMYEALQPILMVIFEKLKLHRVMANYKPNNLRSAALLKRLGFEVEGYAKSYLKINGEWADHVLTSLISNNSV